MTQKQTQLKNNIKDTFIILFIALGTIITVGLIYINTWIGLAFSFGIMAIVIFLIYPPLLIYFSIILSGLHTALVFVEFSIGNTSVTPAGFVWPVIALLIILFLFTSIRTVQIPKYLFGFLFLAIWASFRWLVSPTGLTGIKDILWYSYPFLFSLFIHNLYANQKFSYFLTISKYAVTIILMSSLIPALLYLFSFLTGNASFSSNGPTGPYIASRAISIFLLVPYAVAIAASKAEQRDSLPKIIGLLNFAMIVGSLSRMASVVAIGLLIVQHFFSKNRKKLLFILIVGVLISVIAISQIPILRSRFFYGTDKISGISDAIRRLDLMGRGNYWGTTLDSALENPIFGKGLGSARFMLASVYYSQRGLTEWHPHNEYLQVFHDLGLIGLILLLFSWLGLFFRNYSRWKKSSSKTMKTWSFSAMLSIIALMLLAITDNPFHFPSIIIMVSIVFSFAEIHSRR